MVPKPQKRRQFFREWRKHRHLTQVQAAERMGMDQSTLSRIERDETEWGREFLEAAADAYNCEPGDLLMRNPLIPDAIWSIHDNLRTATRDELEQIDRVTAAMLRRAG